MDEHMTMLDEFQHARRRAPPRRCSRCTRCSSGHRRRSRPATTTRRGASPTRRSPPAAAPTVSMPRSPTPAPGSGCCSISGSCRTRSSASERMFAANPRLRMWQIAVVRSLVAAGRLDDARVHYADLVVADGVQLRDNQMYLPGDVHPHRGGDRDRRSGAGRRSAPRSSPTPTGSRPAGSPASRSARSPTTSASPPRPTGDPRAAIRFQRAAIARSLPGRRPAVRGSRPPRLGPTAASRRRGRCCDRRAAGGDVDRRRDRPRPRCLTAGRGVSARAPAVARGRRRSRDRGRRSSSNQRTASIGSPARSWRSASTYHCRRWWSRTFCGTWPARCMVRNAPWRSP